MIFRIEEIIWGGAPPSKSACHEGVGSVATRPHRKLLRSSGFHLMKLAKLLSADHILLNMKAVEHWPSIVELVDHLITSGQLPPEQREEMLEAFKTREEQVSTGIGSGVAIPHAFSDHLEHVIAVFGRSRAGIDFESLDNAPVHFIVLFIVPRKNYHLHLQTLAAIAKMFTNSEVLRQLGVAESHEEIHAIFEPKTSRVGV
jgi:mannitol/fructose-specific phosphotransferase system IIA component (Ntr-type)